MIQFRTDFTTTAARTSNPVRAMKDDQCLNNNNINVTCYLSIILMISCIIFSFSKVGFATYIYSLFFSSILFDE